MFVGVMVGINVFVGTNVSVGITVAVAVAGTSVFVGVAVGADVLEGRFVGRSVAVAVPVTVAEPVTVMEGVNVLVGVYVGSWKDVPVGRGVEEGSKVCSNEVFWSFPESGVAVQTSGNCLKVAVGVGNCNKGGSSLGGKGLMELYGFMKIIKNKIPMTKVTNNTKAVERFQKLSFIKHIPLHHQSQYRINIINPPFLSV